MGLQSICNSTREASCRDQVGRVRNYFFLRARAITFSRHYGRWAQRDFHDLKFFFAKRNPFNYAFKTLFFHGVMCPHRLVVRTSRRGRDNPGSTPGEDIKKCKSVY